MGGIEREEIPLAVAGILIMVAAVGEVLYLSRNDKNARRYLFVVLILGVVPYVRYAVLNNHSYLHDFFTYRAQAATVLALITAIGAAMRKPANKKKERGSHGR